MSKHLDARPGQIAEKVLLPGDPLRAKFIADTFLTDVFCYNKTRNMLGFTGKTESGEKISVQGSGMGMPSLSIYVNELIREHEVKQIIRVGTAGSLHADVKCRDIIIPQRAYSDSAMHGNGNPFGSYKYFSANKELVSQLLKEARFLGISVKEGKVFSTDTFYDEKEVWKKYAMHGAICVEMEAAELYRLGKKYGIKTASILTISDTVAVESKPLTSIERETALQNMIKIALKV